MSDSPHTYANLTTCKEGVTPTHNCGSRISQLGEPEGGALLDGWRVEPNGDHCCTYCGSLREDEFVSIMEKYADGEPGYKWETTAKRYKFYANRPGVTNASEGGIKFYGWHIDTTPGPEFDRKDAIFHRAIARQRAEQAAWTEKRVPGSKVN